MPRASRFVLQIKKKRRFKEMKMKIIHGSKKIMEKPQFGVGKIHNDYDRGFYCTESLEIAKEWACDYLEDGFQCIRIRL